LEKNPLIQIDQGPTDILYESPSVMVVKKPKGIAVHPSDAAERGTLLNLLFQHNRWLANMETHTDAGVLHVLEKHDHGLMIFNKNDDYHEVLTTMVEKQEISYSYFVTVEGNHEINLPQSNEFEIATKSQKTISSKTIFDVKVTHGNTKTIREVLFPTLAPTDVTFYCYEIELMLPHTGDKHLISLRDSQKEYPTISVYYAPPCSSCREARDFITDNGFLFEGYSVFDEGVSDKMLEVNGGKKVIPTIVIDGQVTTGFDRHVLKSLLGVK
jgi:glutaredoxin